MADFKVVNRSLFVNLDQVAFVEPSDAQPGAIRVVFAGGTELTTSSFKSLEDAYRSFTRQDELRV